MSKIVEPTEIRVLRGPPGSHGFRSGTWLCEYRDMEFKVFSSVPHSCEFKVQDAIVQASAALYLEDRDRRPSQVVSPPTT